MCVVPLYCYFQALPLDWRQASPGILPGAGKNAQYQFVTMQARPLIRLPSVPVSGGPRRGEAHRSYSRCATRLFRSRPRRTEPAASRSACQAGLSIRSFRHEHDRSLGLSRRGPSPVGRRVAICRWRAAAVRRPLAAQDRLASACAAIPRRPQDRTPAPPPSAGLPVSHESVIAAR